MNRFTILSLFLGAGLIVGGAAWIYRPLGPISAGALLLLSAFMSIRKKQ
jgi:hypothetical protein